MRENKLRSLWASGGAAVNCWLAIANTYSAEVMAHEDWDSVTVDLQHGMVDVQASVAMLQAISTTGKVPLARVPWNDPAAIMKVLDAGTYGVICPMINNRAECERFVGACRYAPRGYRSFGPARGLLYGGADYAAHANDTIVTLAMIETEEALANLDDILSVDGLDAVYIGPSDLAISLGALPTPVPADPNVLEAIDTILAAAKRHDVVPGIHCGSGPMAKAMIEKGFQIVTLMNDARLMAAAARTEIQIVRGQR